MIGPCVETPLNCRPENFPVSLFKNEHLDEYYVLYRHGHIVTVKNSSGGYRENKDKASDVQKLEYEGYGRSCYIMNRVIIANKSNCIQFLKIK